MGRRWPKRSAGSTRAGGHAVLAHPGRYRVTATGMRKLLDRIPRRRRRRHRGASRPSHTPEQFAEYATLARRVRLQGLGAAPTSTRPAKAGSTWATRRRCRQASTPIWSDWCSRREPEQRRTVFFLSDRTGITAEMLGNSLLTQFEDFQFRRITIPFVDSAERVAEACARSTTPARREGRRPIVFSSIVDDTMSATIHRDANALTLDLFQMFMTPLEQELGAQERRMPPAARTASPTARLLHADGGDQLHAVARRRRRRRASSARRR